ncbi:uncharacterized protein [Amphiura filiformis]|uniref:uncharacterized protein isoform X2 n=1 Tax=Amphiura filiformis TaxID=82378 RepID=UPI003B222F48
MHGSYYGGGTPRTARQAPYSNGYIGAGSPRQQNIPAANGGPGILFRSRQERVDWRRLASIDVDRIRREYDTSVLQEFVNNVTYCDIEQETDLRTIDPNFIKLFKLAQLIIEYLIHSQSYLSNSVEVVQEQLNQANESHNATKQEFTKLNDELHKAKQESRKRRKQITAQQSIMGLGPNGYHKCPYCDKAFIHATYLQSHLQRKHAEFMTQTEDVEARKENERLEKEIEQMRDKLNLMESQFDDERKTLRQQIEVQKMEQSKMARSARQEEDEKQQMERWKEQQLDMQRTEMEKMQGMFMKELKEMNEKNSSSQRALEDLQSKYGKQSMLGKMQDEDEPAEYKAALKKQQKEQEKLKKQLAKEVTSIKSTMEDELQASERRWKERSRQQKEAHKEEVEQLRDRLEQSKTSLRIEREGGDQVGQKYEQQMKDLRKKNKETERSLKEREKQIKDLRAEMKTVKSKPKTPVPIPASPSPKPMSPSPEETETETEEEEESDISVFEPMDTQQRKRLVDGMRESLQHILTESLARKGVPEGAKGISSQSLENKLKALKQERQNLARRHPKFYDIRDKWKGELANRTKKRGKQTAGSSRPRPSSSASPQRSSSSQSQHRSSTSKQSASQPRYSSTPTRPKSSSSTKSSAPLRTSLKTPPPVAPREPIYDIPPNNKLARPSSKARVSFDEHLGEDSDEDDDDESDDDLSDDSDDEEGEIRTKSQTSQGQHRSQGQQRSQQGQQRSQQGQQRSQQGQRPQTTSKSRSSTEGTIDEESEDDSEWDSEDISELQEVNPSKVTGVSKVTAGQKPTPKRSHHRSKKDGPKVAELSRSIELQLSGRHKDKKPAGGVDLGSTNDSNQLRPASREDERSPSPSIPTIPDADDWDDDDSDSLAVSSLDGSLSAAKPVPTPRQNKPPPGGSRKPTGDTDISNTLGTSLWGSSSNKGSGSGGTGKTSDSVKSSLASVTDFDDDDFDISDEL